MHDLFAGLLTLGLVLILGSLIWSDGELTILIIGILALFATIGIWLTGTGLKKLLKDKNTAALGEESFGYIFKMVSSGAVVNNIPLLNAKILVLKRDGTFMEVVESLENDSYKYAPGEYVKVKYLNEDANILGKVEEEMVPFNLKNYVSENYPNLSNVAEETIYIDGEEYIREDLINR